MFTIENKDVYYPKNINAACSFITKPHILPHRHTASLEIIYCLSGRVSIRCTNDGCDLHEGDFYIVNYGEHHCIYSEEDCLFALIHINLHDVKVPWEDCRKSFFSLLQNRSPAQFYHLQDILMGMLIQFCHEAAMDADLLRELSNALTVLLMNSFNWFSSEDIPLSSRDLYRDRFVRAVRYCQSNYMHKITLDSLADMEHVNTNYFSQVMKKSNYKGFTNMLNYVRCWRAENQLIETDLSISNISYMCGFSDQKYFYSSFEKYWGMTPGQLRAWYRDFIKTPESYNILTDGSPEPALKELMVKNHTKKAKALLTRY